MGTKRIPGLVKQGDIWHIDKRVNSVRICESTGTSELKEAQKYFVRRLETYRQAKVYGVRPKRSFREAAAKFLLENQHKRSLRNDASRLKLLDQYIGDLPLESVHMGTLQHFIDARKKEGVKTRTINHALQLTGHILNLAAKEWKDEHNLTWLHAVPKIRSLCETDVKSAYPLEWEEQNRLFAALPEYLKDMALFAVNTGCRDQEICQLRWSWQVNVPSVPEIGFVFIIPKQYVKNGYLKDADDRLVVLNSIARAAIDRQRGKHPEFVFTYQNRPLSRMLNMSWNKARKKAGLDVRVHDLKHTFGSRLRALEVSFEDRQDLLGHRSTRTTTHYSRAGLINLWKAAERVCDEAEKPNIILLRAPRSVGHVKFT